MCQKSILHSFITFVVILQTKNYVKTTRSPIICNTTCFLEDEDRAIQDISDLWHIWSRFKETRPDQQKKIHRQRQYFMELSLRETLRLLTLLKIMTFLYVETNNPKIKFIMSTVLISALKVFFSKKVEKQRIIHFFF